jgi:hypothetical protein
MSVIACFRHSWNLAAIWRKVLNRESRKIGDDSVVRPDCYEFMLTNPRRPATILRPHGGRDAFRRLFAGIDCPADCRLDW